MLNHYLRIFSKIFRKKKASNIINILGLVVGMVSAIVIAKYVGYSLTFDNFHQNKQSIYQLRQLETKNGNLENSGGSTYQGIAVEAEQAIPEVVNYTRFNKGVERLVTVTNEAGETISYNENNVFTVDSSFLRMFTLRLLQGSQKKALAVPYSAVIARSTAKRYFGNKNPIGETITTRVPWGKKELWTVTGVVEDTPSNSVLQFDMLVCKPVDYNNLWEMPTDHQFIQTSASDADALAQKISDHISNLPIFKDQERVVSVTLMPLIPSLTTFEFMLALVGLGILMLSWINFINLSIAQSLNRLGEVVIRKALGSSHRQLVGQFVLESLLINGAALLLTILCLWLSYSYFEELTGYHLLPLFDNSLHINTLFLISFVIGSTLTSAYPSLFLVSKKVQGLSSLGKTTDRRGQGLRKGLVVAQFAISSVMIIGSYVIASQMTYMMSKDLGFSPTNKLIIKPPKDQGKGKLERMFTIKQELAKLSWVERFTTSSTIPGQSYRQEVYFSLKGSDKKPLLYINAVDTSFLSTYGVKLLAGTNFLTTGGAYYNNDGVMPDRVIINEATARAFGLSSEDAIHQLIVDQEQGKTYTIVGVVENYHKISLKGEIEPTLFRYNPRRGYITLNVVPEVANSFDGKISELKTVWQTVYQDQPFEYFFLTDMYFGQYDAEAFFRNVFKVFTFVSVLLACLGLIGLAMFEVTNGSLEVGVRKTFGASSMGILALFFKKYLFLLLVATIIGVPIAYYFMNSWLEEYSFRIFLGVQHLLTPPLLLLMVALATISLQLIRLSLVNPAKVLREE